MGLRRAKPCRQMQNWLVIQTRPRWEKKVAQQLLAKGVETFCPLIKEKRQWSDRVKTIEKPLLKALLFVRISEVQRTEVRLTEGVINFVYKEGKLVMVKDKTVQHLRQSQQLNGGDFPDTHKIRQGQAVLEQIEKPTSAWSERLNILLATRPAGKLSEKSIDKN